MMMIIVGLKSKERKGRNRGRGSRHDRTRRTRGKPKPRVVLLINGSNSLWNVFSPKYRQRTQRKTSELP